MLRNAGARALRMSLSNGVRSLTRAQRSPLMATQPSRQQLAVRWMSSEEQHGFKAETSKLLDIVTNSIYTDKEVFLRELVSNSADALEKFRHVQTKGETLEQPERELAIRIKLDKEKGTLVIHDGGIGMTKDEMLDNLGTIARSGSKAFVQAQGADSEAAKNVIGQFGVGFYSCFMVGKEVEVFSKSATGGVAHVWKSTGSDSFSIKEVPDYNEAGTRIVIHLKEDQINDYTDENNVTGIIKRYSNYVGFPVFVNDELANQVSAIWARDKNSITQEEYEEFYRFCSHAFDAPLYTLHFKTDVPIDLKALLYVPSSHSEKMGMGRMKPGVSLYSRKVMLDQNSTKLLPEWMRFVKGVVDSEDLPMSLSRENMQDSKLLQSIKRVLTRRMIKQFADEAKRDGQAFNEKFAVEYGNFLKEGVCTDFENQGEIAKLLRFNSSQLDSGKLTSLDEYISRCAPSQNKIYYMSAPTRAVAESSPYFEIFKQNNIEVLFLYNTLDDFVMSNLGSYQGRALVAAESGDIDVEKKKEEKEKDGEEKEETKSEDLPAEEAKVFQDWLSTELDEVVRKITPSTRLKSSPVIIVDHESAALRRMMRMVQQGEDGKTGEDLLPKQHLEINLSHPIVVSLNDMRKSNPKLASAVARQLYDNAVIAAGLIDDPRSMVPRLTKLLETLLESKK